MTNVFDLAKSMADRPYIDDRPCFHRSAEVPAVFCELLPNHDGPHQSRAHVWERDGSGYRIVDASQRRPTIYG